MFRRFASVAAATTAILAATLTPGVSTGAGASTGLCGRITTAPAIKHIVLIMMENTSYSGIIGNASAPYLTSVARACGVASSYHNLTHNSLPNYLGIASGASLSTLRPFDGDCNPSSSCVMKTANVFTDLSSHSKTWKSYAESMPSACSKSNSGYYAPRHNPAVYFSTISSSACRANDVALGTTTHSPMLGALTTQSAPALMFVTPNLCNDMHGASGCPSDRVATGDNWVKLWLPKITGTVDYRSGNTIVFIVWDEGAGGSSGESCTNNTTDQSCHVPAIVIAPSVKPHTASGTRFSHYSLLRTIENLLGVPMLGASSTASSMKTAFNL
jgi:hypothetical protein